MPRLPVGSPARPRSDRWWCRYFAELVWVDELARAPVRSGLRRRTPESGEQSMIVSTWQFLQKQVRGGSLERVAKGVNHGKDPAQINFLSPFASTSFVCFEPGHCSCVIRLVRRSARRRLSIRGDRDSPIFRIAPTSWGCLRTGSIAVQLCRELRSALSVEQGEKWKHQPAWQCGSRPTARTESVPTSFTAVSVSLKRWLGSCCNLSSWPCRKEPFPK